MKAIWHLFKDDVRRLGRNAVTVIIVIGLVTLPSIFSWYNIIACWDVFGNTGNLTVAVANSDAGYKSDLVPLRVNFGDQVTSALRANDQLNWMFTDEEEAIDGARSGRYYAAVVIPESFSRDMMSFYSDDVEHAQITYYSNQKKNAIAPKVTDQGADQVSAQVNRVFAETVSEIAIGVSQALADYADDADINGAIGSLSRHVNHLASGLSESAGVLSAYSKLLGSAQSLVDGSATLLSQARDSAGEVSRATAEAKTGAREAAEALEAAQAALADTLQGIAGDYAGAAAQTDAAFEQALTSAESAEASLRAGAETAAQAGDTARSRALSQAADGIRDASAATQAARVAASERAEKAQREIDEAKSGYDQDLKPSFDQLASTVADADAAIGRVASLLDEAGAGLSGEAGSVSREIDSSRRKLDAAADGLTQSASKLGALSADLSDALSAGDAQALREIIGSDPESLASAIAAPVQLERVAVYPVDNFGSAMAPLYTTLALWIGSLLIMVTLKVKPSARTLESLGHPSPRQVFLGRFCTVALISLMQSTCLAAGNLLFLGVQAVDPLLYLLCFWVAGLVFAFIVYTLVALFANLGKALSVILLIVQVSGGGGSFPLKLLPPVFQAVSPYLPITHAVSAMRAAMFGLYNGDFWMQLGMLVLFTVPLAVLGLVLQKPLDKIVPRFVERVESSKLM